MRKFKKALAFALASAMIVSVVPVSAATSNTAKAGKKVIYTYTVNNGATKDAKQTWIKTTKKSGYTVKYFNQTSSIVSLNKKSGKVVAKKAGTAKIKVNFYNKSGKYVGNKVVKITVKKAPVAKGIAIEKATLNVGETTKVTTSNGAKVYCYSADTSIVKVNKTTGEVTAVAPGTTKIAVRNAITKKRVYVDVTVNAEFGAKQTGAKKITVTGANFTKESKIEITKGSQTVTFDAKNVTIAADGKAMEIVTNSNIMDADYKVKVDDKESTFKGEASKLTAIKAGDNAIANKTTTLPATTSGAAIVKYTAENQFGEDITKTTDVVVTSPRLKDASVPGKIELNVVANDREGDLIPVVIINKDTGINLSKNVKLSARSAISEINIKGFYNKDGKTYSEDTAKTDDFYLLVDMKDQYGEQITEAKFDEDLLLTVGGGLTGLDKVLTKTNKTEKVTVDGVDYFGIKLDKSTSTNKVSAGTATVLLISKLTGDNAQANLTVADGVKVAKFSAAPTGLVLANADNVFEFTAVDTYGNTVENPTEALFAEDGVPAGFKFKKNAKTGKTELIYNPGTKTGLQVVTFITATREVTTLQFTIKDEAKPTTIVGIKDATAGVIVGEKVTITGSSIKFEDQYGQEYTGKVNGTLSYDTTGDVFTGSNGEYTAAKSGDQKLTITYTEGTTKTDYTVTLSARSLDELSNFKVEAKNMAKVTKADATTDVAKNLKVTGTASDGTVITLPASAYTAYVSGNNASAVSGSALGFTDSKKETKDVTVSVIIGNKAGTEVTATVKASNTDSVPTTVTLRDEAQITAGTEFTATNAVKVLKVVDQYGEEIEPSARVKFSGLQDTDVVSGNNTKSATVTVKAASSVVVDYTFDNGLTYTATITVVTPATTK